MESFSKSLQLVHIVDTLGYNFYIKPCTIHHISENIDDINYTIYLDNDTKINVKKEELDKLLE